MSLYFEKLLWVDKRETTYGVDAAPLGAQAVLAFDVNIMPLEVGEVQRRPATPYFRAAETLIANKSVKIDYWVEGAGSGAAGTAPAFGTALRASGFAEQINAGVDVQYLPVSAGYESASGYWFMDGQRHKVLGGRSTAKFTAVANDVPKLIFSRVGLYAAPGASAPPTPDFSAYRKPLVVGQANTPTFTIHGVACVLRSFSVDLGQTLAHRDLVGSETVQITGRAPSGEVLIEAPPLGTKNWFDAVTAETVDALQLIHGSVAGSIVQVDLPKVKLRKPRYESDGGVAMLRMDLDVLPNAGDDEVKFTFK